MPVYGQDPGGPKRAGGYFQWIPTQGPSPIRVVTPQPPGPVALTPSARAAVAMSGLVTTPAIPLLSPHGAGASAAAAAVTAPSTGGPTFTFVSTDGNGVDLYTVTDVNNRPSPQPMRVLVPPSPSGAPHNFIIPLPAENSAPEQGGLGDGLDNLRTLGMHNIYNLTVVQPGFQNPPWYADNVSDPTRQYETFIVSDVVPWIRSHLSITGTEKIWLIGYSKSGLGGEDLILKHPTLFEVCASWDFPGPDMANATDFGADNYGTQANFVNNYQLNTTNVEGWKAPFRDKARIWIGGYNAFQTDVTDYANMLIGKGIAFVGGAMNNITHSWTSGWVAAAVSALSQMSAETTVATDTFDRADGALGSAWTASSDGAPVISSNHVIGVTPSAFNAAYRSSGSYGNDMWSQIQTTGIALPTGGGGGIVAPTVRVQASGQTCYAGLYFWNNGNPVLQIYKRVSGTFTALGTPYTAFAFGSTLPANTILKLVANGNTISLQMNGIERCNVADTSIPSGGVSGILTFDLSTLDMWAGGTNATTVAVPSIITLPVITGTPTVGQTLTCSQGSWTGAPTGYAYQWQSDASGSYANISGQTASTYVLQSSDAGHHVRCQVTASNAIGPSTAVLTGPVGMIVTTVVGTDDFNRSNGALGANWTQTNGDQAITIAGNAGVGNATSNVSGARRTAAGETYGNDQWSEIVVGALSNTFGAGGFVGPSVRSQSGGGAYTGIYFWNGGSPVLAIYGRVSSGAFTLLSSNFLLPPGVPLAPGTVLRLVAKGNLFSLMMNGIEVVTLNQGSLPTGGSPGAFTFDQSTFDNWSGGNV